MKRILYLTTSIDPRDYAYLLKQGAIMPNPSNQNFHSRVIEAMKKEYDVVVLSLVPFVAKKSLLIDNEVYRYTECGSSKLQKFCAYNQFKRAALAIKEDVDAIIFDSLSVPLGKTAKLLQNKKKIPLMAILTDNPFNISSLPTKRAKAILENAKCADAAISLTSSLLDIFSLNNRPHFLAPGIANQNEIVPFMAKRPFLYFAGSLLERYGVNKLIDSYPPDASFDLYIAGHGKTPLTKKNGIHYLGQVSLEENLAYQKGALAVINPRPFDQKLDTESVPSKMFEYLANASSIISTENTFFHQHFEHDINWIGKGSDEDFANLWKAVSENKLLKISDEARERLFQEYGEEAFLKGIASLIGDQFK